MKKALLLMAILLVYLSMSAPRAVLAYSGPLGVKIHGFVSQGYLYSDEYNYLAHNSKDGSFEYDEMGVNFASQLTDRLRVGVQLFARDIGDAANNKVTLDWAYGDYRVTNWLGLRAGKIKLPIGLYNETRDVDMLRTSIVMPQGIYNDLLRDSLIATNGVGAYGNVDVGPVGNIEYQLLTGNIEADTESGIEKYTASGIMKDLPAGLGLMAESREQYYSNKTAYCGALRWQTPLPGLRIGYSRVDTTTTLPFEVKTSAGAKLDDLDIVTRRILDGYSAEFTWSDLIVAAEYVQTDDSSESESSIGTTVNRTVTERYYLSVSYRFTDLFTMGAYYAEYYPDIEDKEGDDQRIDHNAWEKDLSLTLRFDINDYCVFKLEGHSVNGTANVLLIDNMDNDYDNEDWYYGAAKVTVSF